MKTTDKPKRKISLSAYDIHQSVQKKKRNPYQPILAEIDRRIMQYGKIRGKAIIQVINRDLTILINELKQIRQFILKLK